MSENSVQTNSLKTKQKVVEKLEADLENCTEQRNLLSNTVDKQDSQIQQLRKLVEEMDLSREDQNGQLTVQTQQIELETQRLEEIGKRVKELETQLYDKMQELSYANSNIIKLQREKDNHANQLSALQDKVKSLMHSRDMQMEDYRNLKEHLDLETKRVQELTDALSQKEREITGFTLSSRRL